PSARSSRTAARRSCSSIAAVSRPRSTVARAARPCGARAATSRSSSTATRCCAATTAVTPNRSRRRAPCVGRASSRGPAPAGSGRAAAGRVLVQTVQAGARAIALGANHDVPRFLVGELERRRELGYPPFRHLVRIVVAGPDPATPLQALSELRAALGDDDVLGPAPLLRLRGRYRAQLVAKTAKPRRLAAHAGRLLAASAPAMRRADLTAVVDVDPQDF